MMSSGSNRPLDFESLDERHEPLKLLGQHKDNEFMFLRFHSGRNYTAAAMMSGCAYIKTVVIP